MDARTRNLILGSVFFCALLAGGSRLLERAVPIKKKSIVRDAVPQAAEADAFNNKGVAHLDAQQFPEAITALKKARLFDPKNKIIRKNLSVAYFSSGKDLYSQGQIPDAIENIQMGLALDPANASAKFLLKKAKREQGFEKNKSLFIDFYYRGAHPQAFTAAKPRISHLIDTAHFKVLGDLFFEPSDRIQVHFYDPQNFQATLTPDAWVGGLFDGKIHIPLGDYDSEKEKIKSVVFHEYAHAVIYRMSPACPSWLNEGLAQLIENKDPAAADLRIRRHAAHLLTPHELQARFTGLNSRQAGLAYDMSLSLAHRLKYYHGYPGITAFLKELGTTGNEKALFEKHFFMSFESFYAHWKREQTL